VSAVAQARRRAAPTALGQSRRRAELGLLVLAIAITGGAYTLASLGQTSSVPANIGPFFAIITALFFAAHLAIRRLAPEADGLLFPLVALLNGIGYVFIARLDPELADNQATWTFVGIAAFVLTLAFVRRVRDLERYRYTFLAMGLILLVLPLAPGLGVTINGARIWVALGPISFQPGEFAKIAFALFFASYLVE
jgi:peptidoglycan glycosyltransferase